MQRIHQLIDENNLAELNNLFSPSIDPATKLDLIKSLDSQFKESPLARACRLGNKEIVELLLKNEADISLGGLRTRKCVLDYAKTYPEILDKILPLVKQYVDQSSEPKDDREKGKVALLAYSLADYYKAKNEEKEAEHHFKLASRFTDATTLASVQGPLNWRKFSYSWNNKNLKEASLYLSKSQSLFAKTSQSSQSSQALTENKFFEIEMYFDSLCLLLITTEQNAFDNTLLDMLTKSINNYLELATEQNVIEKEYQRIYDFVQANIKSIPVVVTMSFSNKKPIIPKWIDKIQDAELQRKILRTVCESYSKLGFLCDKSDDWRKCKIYLEISNQLIILYKEIYLKKESTNSNSNADKNKFDIIFNLNAAKINELDRYENLLDQVSKLTKAGKPTEVIQLLKQNRTLIEKYPESIVNIVELFGSYVSITIDNEGLPKYLWKNDSHTFDSKWLQDLLETLSLFSILIFKCKSFYSLNFLQLHIANILKFLVDLKTNSIAKDQLNLAIIELLQQLFSIESSLLSMATSEQRGELKLFGFKAAIQIYEKDFFISESTLSVMINAYKQITTSYPEYKFNVYELLNISFTFFANKEKEEALHTTFKAFRMLDFEADFDPKLLNPLLTCINNIVVWEGKLFEVYDESAIKILDEVMNGLKNTINKLLPILHDLKTEFLMNLYKFFSNQKNDLIKTGIYYQAIKCALFNMNVISPKLIGKDKKNKRNQIKLEIAEILAILEESLQKQPDQKMIEAILDIITCCEKGNLETELNLLNSLLNKNKSYFDNFSGESLLALTTYLHPSEETVNAPKKKNKNKSTTSNSAAPKEDLESIDLVIDQFGFQTSQFQLNTADKTVWLNQLQPLANKLGLELAWKKNDLEITAKKTDDLYLPDKSGEFNSLLFKQEFMDKLIQKFAKLIMDKGLGNKKGDSSRALITFHQKYESTLQLILDSINREMENYYTKLCINPNINSFFNPQLFVIFMMELFNHITQSELGSEKLTDHLFKIEHSANKDILPIACEIALFYSFYKIKDAYTFFKTLEDILNELMPGFVELEYTATTIRIMFHLSKLENFEYHTKLIQSLSAKLNANDLQARFAAKMRGINNNSENSNSNSNSTKSITNTSVEDTVKSDPIQSIKQLFRDISGCNHPFDFLKLEKETSSKKRNKNHKNLISMEFTFDKNTKDAYVYSVNKDNFALIYQLDKVLFFENIIDIIKNHGGNVAIKTDPLGDGRINVTIHFYNKIRIDKDDKNSVSEDQIIFLTKDHKLKLMQDDFQKMLAEDNLAPRGSDNPLPLQKITDSQTPETPAVRKFPPAIQSSVVSLPEDKWKNIRFHLQCLMTNSNDLKNFPEKASKLTDEQMKYFYAHLIHAMRLCELLAQGLPNNDTNKVLCTYWRDFIRHVCYQNKAINVQKILEDLDTFSQLFNSEINKPSVSTLVSHPTFWSKKSIPIGKEIFNSLKEIIAPFEADLFVKKLSRNTHDRKRKKVARSQYKKLLTTIFQSNSTLAEDRDAALMIMCLLGEKSHNFFHQFFRDCGHEEFDKPYKDFANEQYELQRSRYLSRENSRNKSNSNSISNSNSNSNNNKPKMVYRTKI